jgi:hypothetical protein
LADVWSDSEIDLIVADYFAMLEDELADHAFNKAQRNRDLQRLLPRSRKSIEFKHLNISAVLASLGQPWIIGYKPAFHYQKALVDGVLRRLEMQPSWLIPQMERLEARGVQDTPTLWIGPPPTQLNEPPPADPNFIAAVGLRFDVAARDARNSALGKAGEEVALHHERRNLQQCGRRDLAERVRWTSVEDGDGFGFDIASYEPDGRKRLIEVKTTNGWQRTPFHISRNELAAADANRESWHLLRIWNFAREPKAFALRPPLEAHAELTPTSFLAHLR